MNKKKIIFQKTEEKNMICPKCNADLPDNVCAFCPMCGEKLPEPQTPAAPAGPQYTEPTPSPEVQYAQPVSSPEVQYAQPVPSASAVKFCPQCGATAPQDANVCPMCGHLFAVTQPAIPGDPTKNGFAVASLVLGILGLISFAACCIGIYVGWLFGGLSLIFGIIGRKSQKSGMGTAGLVMGIITLIVWLILIVFVILIAAGALNNGYSQNMPRDFEQFFKSLE